MSQVSGASAASDGNETSDENAAPAADQPHAPHIQVLKGNPSDAELAALIAVLGSASGGAAPREPEFSRWGLPVDRLRYAIHSWQRVSLVQRTHMRGR